MNKQFFSDRPRLLTWISVLFALILAARLFSLQIIHGEDYSQSFEESVTRKIRIPAQRGRILDRNGTVLAESVPVRDITIVDKTGNSREENARLNTIIQNTELSKIYQTAPQSTEYYIEYQESFLDKEDEETHPKFLHACIQAMLQV